MLGVQVERLNHLGISLVVFQPAFGPPRRAITTLEPLHQQVLAFLGTSWACFYHVA
jgi:hypothetical protein